MFDYPRRAAHEREEFWRERRADHADDDRDGQCESDRLHCGACSAIWILFTDATSNHRHRTDTQTDRERVNQSHERLGETDSRGGVGAEMRHPENVDDSKNTLHDHLEDHGNSEQQDRASDRTTGIVSMRAANRLL